MVSAALITPGGDPVSLCILTIPLYILYEFAIVTGIIVERRKAIREWKEWDEELQGPKPDYPKAENRSYLFYLVILTLIGLISFAAWKYKDQLMDALQMLSVEDSQIPTPAFDANASQSPATKTTRTMQHPTLDGSFIIELSPINESNASGSESSDAQDMKRFRAKIVSD